MARRTLLLAVLLFGLPPILPAIAGSVCGNGVVEGNERCDGGSCCTAACAFAQAGTICGSAAGPCDLPDLCNVDGQCDGALQQPDGTPCEDGDGCTTDGVCRVGQCISPTQRCSVDAEAPRPITVKPGKVALIVTCSVPNGGGGTCSAAAFLPPPGTAGLLVAGDTSSPEVACDVSRQITRTARKKLDETGVARLKLRLNKLARRLIRALPVTAALTLNVCTTIKLADGETITLVDVLNVARREARR